ncbi:hypothetical protein Droror1_Dr00018872 [Drosera rotundifolia]
MMAGNETNQFPGFQVHVPKDEYLPPKMRRALSSRLQRRAPSPIQLKYGDHGAQDKDVASSLSSSMCFHDKAPIPLLSPLVVCPSLLVSSDDYVHNENLAV